VLVAQPGAKPKLNADNHFLLGSLASVFLLVPRLIPYKNTNRSPKKTGLYCSGNLSKALTHGLEFREHPRSAAAVSLLFSLINLHANQ
jgi:hypothetical protein